MTNENTDTTDEPTKAELHDRVQQLESTVEKLMPSRRDALRMGAAGLAGAAGLSATSGSAAAATGSAGQIGDSSNRPDIFADTVDANQLTGVSTGKGLISEIPNVEYAATSQELRNVTAPAVVYLDSGTYEVDNLSGSFPAGPLRVIGTAAQFNTDVGGNRTTIQTNTASSLTLGGRVELSYVSFRSGARPSSVELTDRFATLRNCTLDNVDVNVSANRCSVIECSFAEVTFQSGTDRCIAAFNTGGSATNNGSSRNVIAANSF